MVMLPHLVMVCWYNFIFAAFQGNFTLHMAITSQIMAEIYTSLINLNINQGYRQDQDYS